eukprot:jgi/Botrbrau1/18272/Bobra.0179s0006.1
MPATSWKTFLQVCNEEVGRDLLSRLGDNIKKLRDDSRGKHVKSAMWQLYERLPYWEEPTPPPFPATSSG